MTHGQLRSINSKELSAKLNNMYTNISPIDLSFLKKESISFISKEALDIFVRKTLRARDSIRTHWLRLNHQNSFLAHRIKNIFFDPLVSEIITNIESYPTSQEWPRKETERLLLAVVTAIQPTDRFIDPFSLIPYV